MHGVPYEVIVGIGVGIVMALPTGPIGFLVVRRMILYGFRPGMWSAFGSISGDAFYAIVALLGMSKLHRFLISVQTPVRFFAGIYLLYLGIMALRKARQEITSDDKEFSPMNDFMSTFLLAFASPHNFASFVIAFSIVGIGTRIAGAGGITIFGVAMLVGSIFWWVFAGLGIEKMKRGGQTASPVWIKVLTAWVLIISGAGFIIWSALQILGVV